MPLQIGKIQEGFKMSLKNMQYKKTSHFGHAILSILFFPWIIVWAFIAMSNNNYNNNLDVIHAIKNK
ncbi:hypothetical protein PJKIFABJ_00182 [Pseudomonas phage PE09]|uniref:Uncharacterized protein n=2 Tax=Otagovirus TaxID=2560197 RepID=A0A7S7YCR7_9CAUD|nr:hypothetical protein QGX22_gp072 [Pseudomonas phage PE09]YP_010768469.1 hypothetical protein QGX23_gp070 [Pseudomonas phage PN09]QHZ60118.1 hypothetical protein PJKIFABJ_00182 [Pseudomonas phage PE09]QPB10582.1 hypothetical protein PN09_161 [Pseudomonas phage PN09]